jgi:phosphotransferase family enzyme
MAFGRALPYPRNVKFLIFVDDEVEPSWILRCHRDAAIAAREALVLGQMQSRGYRVQPELVGCDSCEDMHALLLRFCRGWHGNLGLWRSLQALGELSSQLADVQTGLAEWAVSTFDSRLPDTAHLCRAIQLAGATGDETDIVRTLDQARECLVNTKAPALPQHGDCCTANLLWDDGAIRILDWEHFGFAFEPFLDIWMFALSLCEDSGDVDAASLFAGGANATAAEGAVRRYAESVGLTAWVGRQVFPLAVARFIHFNVPLGRMELARRMRRILDAYLADSSRFMSRLES